MKEGEASISKLFLVLAVYFWFLLGLVGVSEEDYYAGHIISARSVGQGNVSLCYSLVHHFLDNESSFSFDFIFLGGLALPFLHCESIACKSWLGNHLLGSLLTFQFGGTRQDSLLRSLGSLIADE